MTMEKFYITDGGNFLRRHPDGNFYFQTPSGSFLREVSENEAEYLVQNLLQAKSDSLQPHPELMPQWKFVTSVRIFDDYSKYKPETCNNGGDYSFHYFQDWYVAKFPNGEWKFGFISRSTTSAEFDYDELNDSFQSNCVCLSFYNSAGPEYFTQSNDTYDLIDKYLEISNFSHLWHSEYKQMDGFNSCVGSALKFSDKKAILQKLSDIGLTKNKTTLRNGKRNHTRRIATT